LFRQSFDQLSNVRLLDGYDVVICRSCGAGFADDIPAQSVFDQYYRDLSKYESHGIQAPGPVVAEQRFRDMAGLLTRFVRTPEARIFEIGCAEGGLLKAVRDLGFPNVVGSDPSPGCMRAASERFGIPGLVGTVFDVAPEQPFDFLILTGVMEHIRDLDRTVEKFHELLAVDGRVYLEVPDASRYAPQLDAPFQEFSLEHINYFSRISLGNLMRARGFRVLETGLTVRSLFEISCPCTYGIFEKSSENSAIGYDHETEIGLGIYIEGCRAEDERICSAIRESVLPENKMIVWGVGAHTLRLLANGGLDPSRIALFVDSSPKYQNQELRGIRVASPEELRGRREPILISSRGFQSEIQHQIQNVIGLQNPLILLYPAGRN
jgi:SAM-dependent methyltransferase